MQGMRSRTALLMSVALLGAGSLAACGDDEEDSGSEETSSAPVEEVTLTADETDDGYSFDLSDTPTAETKSVVFDNQGEEGHFLVFAKVNEGFTLDEAVELQGKKGSAEVLIEQEAGPGESKTIEIEDPIEPGEYAMLCPIPSPDGPHYKLGQLEEFSIE